jgi:hypothetical protein
MTYCGDFSLYLLRLWLPARESGEAYENVSKRNLKRNLKYLPTWAVPRLSPSFVFPRVSLFPLGVFGSFCYMYVCGWIYLCVCVFVCVCVCVCVLCIYVYMYVCMYVCECVYIYT